jgi:hypothetical protein
MIVTAPISVGELIDKITILELKLELITDQAKLSNVRKELDELTNIFDDITIPPIEGHYGLLKSVNRELWHIEDFKRACERERKFSEEFIDAARKVYLKNDQRAMIKREINEICGSDIVEEKSY